MSANAMSVQDVYQILNDIHSQVTGQTQIAPVTTNDYVSIANTLLQMNVDMVYGALMNTIAKTVFSTRPYSRQFGGLIVDNVKWGGIIRKIQFGDTAAVMDSAFSNLPADGQAVDHYIINRGEVLETRYYGSAEYQDVMTVFRDQLINAFSGPEQLGSFIAAKANEVNNKWVQWTEDLARGLVLNAIMAKTKYYDVNSPTKQHCLHLLTMYNTDTGASPALTIQDIMTEQYAKPFWEYVRAKIRSLQRSFTNRNMLHYESVIDPNTGNVLNIIRHTPYANQKVYLLAPYMDLMETSTLTEAFHNDPLKYADYEGVAYWQTPYSVSDIQMHGYVVLEPSTGSFLDQYAATDETFDAEKIIGVVFDEDFMNVNIKDTIIQNTPMNARGLYYNTWLTAHAQYCQDFTEKCCVLLLD